MKILIVDDNIENIDVMMILLKSENYDIISANNGKEALEKLRAEKVDLIISDILMPVMDGFQLCRECKKDKELSKISFIFYTASYIDAKDEELAMTFGVQKFLRKPQEPEIFLKHVKEVIEKLSKEQIVQIKFDEHEELEVLNLYSERLVAKLEKKNMDLENEIALRKVIDSKLTVSEARFSLAAEGTKDGLWDWDTSSDQVFYSDQYSRMLGYEPEEFPTKKDDWADLLHPEDKDIVLKKVDDYLKSKDDYYEATFRIKVKDGSYKWINARGKALFDDNGKAYRFLGFQTDITEKKLQEQELINAKEKAEESDKLKTAFLHNISHEIRTPLNGIIGFSDLLADPSLSPEKREQFSQTIYDCSNQLLSIVNDIISIATIEAGHEKPHEKETNINELLQLLKIQGTIKTDTKNLAFNVSSSLTDKEASVLVDETKLTQILTNLVNNAKKFTREGHINVTCGLDGNFIKFTVEDTGIGITNEMHEKIFDRFFQVNHGSDRFYGGTGLGLSIVKSYVHFLNGTIELDSKPGIGSVFTVFIPYKPVSQIKTENIPMHSDHKNIQHTNILIAEDEPTNAELIKEYLSGLNISIIYAANGSQAVEVCKTNPSISLVLMDVKMPGIDGYEAARQIKEFRPNLPIIIQTAYVFQDEREKSMSAYFDGFIEKPIIKQVLLDTLQKHL